LFEFDLKNDEMAAAKLELAEPGMHSNLN